ncbi:MAG: oxidoreductase [Halobacteriales archaeon]|nr:oxidoreductase [Halobacteriales archaeon]
MSTVLITGASSGIGKATARRLVTDEHTVYAVARRVERMEDLRDAGAHPLRMDITEDEDVERVVRTIEEVHGGVDVLVNNAGFALYGAVEDTSIDDARYQFEVNLFGLARLTRRVLPYMRERGAGTIINVSSMGGKIFTPLGAWYHASKHALEGWSDCLRLELRPKGIDVVVIEPGIIDTELGDIMTGPMMERSGEGPYAELAHDVLEASREAYEDGRASSPEGVADVIAKAVEARRPKTRYPVGAFARPLLAARRWLSDRMFDRLIMSQY